MKQLSQHRIAWGLLLVRFLVGWIFLSEGIQKFLFPAALGAGRFEKIGIPAPHFVAPFVGATEIVCGTLLILGFFTLFAVWPYACRYPGCDHDNQGSIAPQAGFLGSDARGTNGLLHDCGAPCDCPSRGRPLLPR